MKLKSFGANRTEVDLGNGLTVFFSYKTPVAFFREGLGYFKTSTKWSVTTSKHINQWLDGVRAKECTQEYIDNLVK